MKHRFIAIEGNIGAGKTTLARMLAHHFGSKLLLETFEDNAFLPKFYKDPERYAFPLELSFLAERYQQLNSIDMTPDLFSDRTVSDYFLSKSLIFARTNLNGDEFRLFWQLFEIMFQRIVKPDLLIFLYSPISQLQANIKKRGRIYEQEIGDEYLEKIQQQYLDFLRKHDKLLKVMVIDTSEMDFVASEKDFSALVEKIAGA